jgi:SAM-dependent methyltransferase
VSFLSVALRRAKHRLLQVSDDSQQGFDAESVWTPKYVDELAANVSERYRYMPVLGRIDRFLQDCKSILDVGCGWMPYTPDDRYTGIDVSVAMLARARELHPDIELVHGNAFNLPFSNSSFDGVRSSGMLRHTKDWRSALREMIRVARLKLAFTILVGDKESRCGVFQWKVRLGDVLTELPSEPTIWVVKRWRNMESVLFKVAIP